VAHAFSYAGREDAESNRHGAHMIREAAAIIDSLQVVQIRIKNMKTIVKHASRVVDEAAAQRRSQAAKYTV
jgi:hypothetical protein